MAKASSSRRTTRPAAPTLTQQLDRAIAKNTTEILASHEANYRRHRSAWAALGAVYICLQHDRKFPSWLKRYFEEAYPGLQKAYRAAPAQLPVLLARALGFTRPGRPKRNVDRNEEIALAVADARRGAGSLKAAKHQVAIERELSYEIVDRAYRERNKRQKVT